MMSCGSIKEYHGSRVDAITHIKKKMFEAGDLPVPNRVKHMPQHLCRYESARYRNNLVTRDERSLIKGTHDIMTVGEANGVSLMMPMTVWEANGKFNYIPI
ncbi:hypothetical protein ACVQ90_01530 [Staphylococcus aureus]